jgi:hypothetical protein
MKSWRVWFAGGSGTIIGVIATVAVVASNLDKILSISAEWIGPSITSLLSPKATISVLLDTGLAIDAEVFVADPRNETRAIAVSRVEPGHGAMLSVPADTVYTIGWQGAKIEAGVAAHVLAVKGKSLFRLVRIGETQDQIKVSLRQEDSDKSALAVAEPSAKLLLSAKAVQAVSDPSTPIATSALPELDRAVSIIGLFETGTTECARRLSFVPTHSSTGATVEPFVGCLGISIPGWLTDVITSLDADEAHPLDTLLGITAASIRKYAQDPQAVPPEAQLRQAMERLATSPEFWIQYQGRVLAAYAQAADAARQIGLISARGRLLVFDRLVNGGPNAVARGTRSYAQQYPKGAPGQPDSEAARIRALGEILKAQIPKAQLPPGFAALIARRIDTIVSGHGSISGISFNLDQLGVSDTE